MGSLSVGDTVYLINKESQGLEESKVQQIKYIFSKETIYSIDVETSDLYLTMEEDIESPKYSIIQHNFQPNCYEYYCQYYWFNYSGCGPSYSYAGYNGKFCSPYYPYCDSYMSYGGQTLYCGSLIPK